MLGISKLRNEYQLYSLHNVHRMKAFIHQEDNWPDFTCDNNHFIGLLSEVRNLQGRLIRKMETFGFDLRNKAKLQTLKLDVVKTSEIERSYKF